LRGLLKTMHKGTRHTGKAPEALRASRENADRLKDAAEKTGQGDRRTKILSRRRSCATKSNNSERPAPSDAVAPNQSFADKMK
jgi:hypothetical protein